MESFTNDDHKSENLQFDNYRSLISAEIELIQRVFEIRQNFSDSERPTKTLYNEFVKSILKNHFWKKI